MRPTRTRELSMAGTPITPQRLLQNGFEEQLNDGKVFYVKEQKSVTYSYGWIPCNMDFGQPLCSLTYVNTMEELEQLMQEGGRYDK